MFLIYKMHRYKNIFLPFLFRNIAALFREKNKMSWTCLIFGGIIIIYSSILTTKNN